MINKIHQYNVLNIPWPLTDESVDCCVTSPPYWGLRDYGTPGQIGLESTPEGYVEKMVRVFEEVRRVLKPQGTLWLNLGDSYASAGRNRTEKQASDLKPKDLVGIPWMVAFALRAAGWYLRSDIIWAKKNCMPESVTDRPTRSHEYIFLLSKSARYYYDHEAIKEPAIYDVDGTGTAARKARQKPDAKSTPDCIRSGIRPAGFKDAAMMNGNAPNMTGMRNKRDVWTVAPAQFPEAHFATFPEQLITPCILAGCPKDGIVLDPFMGAGTTALVAKSHGRNYIGFELNPEYIRITEDRLKKEFGMFANF